MAVAEGQKRQLWDTTVDLNLTPGHTPGTLSVVFAAKDGSLVHRVLLWGGTAYLARTRCGAQLYCLDEADGRSGRAGETKKLSNARSK